MVIKVVLTRPSKYYTIGPSNPKVGTEYECEGVVESVVGQRTLYLNKNNYKFDMLEVIDGIENDSYEDNTVYVEVIWDNGNCNTYNSGELTVCNKKLPRCISIW